MQIPTYVRSMLHALCTCKLCNFYFEAVLIACAANLQSSREAMARIVGLTHTVACTSGSAASGSTSPIRGPREPSCHAGLEVT